MTLRRQSGSGGPVPARPAVSDVLATSGTSLPHQVGERFQRALGHSFSDVSIHTDEVAAASARAVGANAFTVGRHIFFGTGRYAPETAAGQRLLTHELVHVIQQSQTAEDRPSTVRIGANSDPAEAEADRLADQTLHRPLHQPTSRDAPIQSVQASLLQRDCSDPDFCKPYATAAEAASAESNLRTYYLPVEGAKFGSSSQNLYERYLSRRPGDSLVPVLFDSPSSDVVQSFADSSATKDDQDEIIDKIGARLSRAPGPLADDVPTTMSIENFMGRGELDSRPINYSNPFSIAGHIAGGIGSSDAGADYRKIEWGKATLTKVPLIGSTGYVHVETTLHYEVFDAIDFCPGDCGSSAEQWITIPMSRLEESGEAYDQPFMVKFVPEPRSKRFFYS